MSEPVRRSNRPLLIKLALAAIGLVGAVMLVARGYDVKGLIRDGLALIRDAGPVAFFGAMAVLPAVGAPLSFFSITAGSVFGPQLGTGTVLVLAAAAITANMALSYVLASRAFRPVLERVLQRLGYRLPQVNSGDVNDLIILLRVTPGIPFPVQNYLLGLSGAPFVRYLLLSAAIQLPINCAFVFFGDALLSGRGRVAFLSLLLLLALMVGAQLVRKHYGAKKKAAE